MMPAPTPLPSGLPRDRGTSHSLGRRGGALSGSRTGRTSSAREPAARRGCGACTSSCARSCPSELPSAFSFGLGAAQSTQDCEGGARSHLFAAAALDVAIDTTARAEPPAILPAERLHRHGERHPLQEERPEVDLPPAKPSRLELIDEAQPVPHEGRRRLGIRWNPFAGRLEDQTKRLTEGLTIAREAAAAPKGQFAANQALQVD